MKLARTLVIAFLATLSVGAVACGSSSDEELPTSMPEARANNPAGLAYPTDNLGTQARRQALRGDRIANLAFRGRRGGALEGELTTLSMADYYDPSASDHRTLYVFAAAKWCSICARVAESLERQRGTLEAQGARFLVLLVNGDEQGSGPSLTEFDRWAASHPMGIDLGVDVRATATIPYGLSAVPFNMLIDTRTMEILDAQVGEPNLEQYVGAALAFTLGTPSYPLPE